MQNLYEKDEMAGDTLDWIMIVIVFAALFGIGKLALWLFGDFIEILDKQKSNVPSNNTRVLLFGVSKTAYMLAEIFESRYIEYLQVENERQIDMGESFTHLIALSDSDLENLMISRIAERMMNISLQLIMCNELRNDSIFKKNGSPYFYRKEHSADEIFRQMFPMIGEIPKVAAND